MAGTGRSHEVQGLQGAWLQLLGAVETSVRLGFGSGFGWDPVPLGVGSTSSLLGTFSEGHR